MKPIEKEWRRLISKFKRMRPLQSFFFGLLSLLIVLPTSCSMFEQINEVKQFALCDFSINEIKIIKLGNTDVSEYQSIDDVNLSDILMFGQQLISGKLPASLSVDVQVVNNQNSKAAISGLRWQLYMKGEEYGSGELVQYLEVLPGQAIDFTVIADFNLMKLLASEDLQSVLDLALDIENREKFEKLEVTVKVKPYFKSGTTIKEYPGYINIRL